MKCDLTMLYNNENVSLHYNSILVSIFQILSTPHHSFKPLIITILCSFLASTYERQYAMFVFPYLAYFIWQDFLMEMISILFKGPEEIGSEG